MLAKGAMQRSMQQAAASYEPGHPSIATGQSNLATVLKDLGELEEARDLLRMAYRSLRDKLGPEHPSTKTVLRNLGAAGGDAAD